MKKLYKIICASDLHGDFPDEPVENCDLFLYAGDMTNNGTQEEFEKFWNWWDEQRNPSMKFCIPGNHDHGIYYPSPGETEGVYDHESGKIRDLVVFVPETPLFDAKDYTWRMIPANEEREMWKGIDPAPILLTHAPPWGFGDSNPKFGHNYGSMEMLKWLRKHKKTVKLVVCGHVHAGRGVYLMKEGITVVNTATKFTTIYMEI